MTDHPSRPIMIFHAPYPLAPDPAAASRLRPLRMRWAFEEIGYEVMDVSGTVSQRRAGLRRLKDMLSTGRRPEFLYCENSTQPNALATSLRTGFAPLLDYSIMRLTRRRAVPVGVFYRDAYWRMPGLRAAGTYGLASNLLQRADLVGYRHNGVHFFLPSAAMSSLVGLTESDSFSALPPGGDSGRVLPLPTRENGLRLVYVGGLGGDYDLTVFVAALARVGGVFLDLVAHQSQWREALRRDLRLGQSAITVLHRSADELEPVYSRTHIGVLAVKPSEYWSIAAPVKLYEYLSYGRPVIVTRGTEAGRIIEANGAGWVIDHDEETLVALLKDLRDQPGKVGACAEAARRAATRNTWADRARTVVRTLSSG